MSAVFNDGNIPYGSRILSLSSSAGTPIGVYVAENIELVEPTTAIRRLDELAEPNGAVYIADWKTGTATLQLATTSSTIPTIGNIFNTVFAGLSVTQCIVNQVSRPEVNTLDKKVNIQFTQVLNPVV